MRARPHTMVLAATGAAALPALIALASSSSCSLAELYAGAGAQGGGAATGSSASTTSSASASSSSSSGAGGMDAGPDAPACPADMIVIPSPAGAFCVDRLEATNADYTAFLAGADAAALKEPAAVCGWKTTHAPLVALDAGDALPVLGVDWCDAFAYCAWRGRRLCGAVGGGAIDPDKRDSALAQWFSACARGTDNLTFPYGYVFDLSACAYCDPDAGCDPDAASSTSHPAEVGSKPGCEGGYEGLLDMSGNASEWEDSCGDAGVLPDASDDAGQPIKDPRYDLCTHRGGSFYFPRNGASGLTCAACVSKYCKPATEARRNRPRDVGVRCCLDLPAP